MLHVKSFLKPKKSRSGSIKDSMSDRSGFSSLADLTSKTQIDTDDDDNTVNIGIVSFETSWKVLVDSDQR